MSEKCLVGLHEYPRFPFLVRGGVERGPSRSTETVCLEGCTNSSSRRRNALGRNNTRLSALSFRSSPLVFRLPSSLVVFPGSPLGAHFYPESRVHSRSVTSSGRRINLSSRPRLNSESLRWSRGNNFGYTFERLNPRRGNPRRWATVRIETERDLETVWLHRGGCHPARCI